MNDKCYICNTYLAPFQWHDGIIINCPVCGEYEPSENFLLKRSEYSLGNSHLLSGAIRENYEKGVIFKINDAQELLDSVVIPKNPLEAIDHLLLYVAEKSFSNSGTVALNGESDYSLAYAKDVTELHYFIQLARELGYFFPLNFDYNCRLAVKGWERINELSKLQVNSTQAFVAMSFNPILYPIWQNGFQPALKQAGYDAIRVDTFQTNGKIDDKIIADIRKSGLVVADFTEHKNGAYFEAGFALGLGIPLIWTCREDDIDNSHFDTRQYNHILWSDSTDLKEKLINRIEATLPNRPKLKLLT